MESRGGGSGGGGGSSTRLGDECLWGEAEGIDTDAC